MSLYESVEVSQKDVLRFFLGASSAVGQGALIESQEIPEQLPDEGCLFVWKRDVPLLPYAIVATPNTLAKILPKLMALPMLGSPVTNLFRAWSIGDIWALNRRIPNETVSSRPEAFTGLMIGELVNRIGPSVELNSLASSSVRRTLAYLLANLHGVGASEAEVEKAVSVWTHVADLTNNSIDPNLVELLKTLYSFVRSLPQGPRVGQVQVGIKLLDWLKKSFGNEISYHGLFDRLSDSEQILQGASREERFEALMDLIQLVRRSIWPNGTLGPIIIGYLLSLIEPGSLDFLQTSHELELDAKMPGVICSYAMFSALACGQEFLLRDSGFGLHVVLSGLQLPRAPDISIHELLVLRKSISNGDFAVRTAVPSFLEVELIPHVSAAFFVGQRRGDVSGAGPHNRETGLSEMQISDLESIANRIEDLSVAVNRFKASSVQVPIAAAARGKRLHRKK